MRSPTAIALALLLAIAFLVWRDELWSVQAPGRHAVALALLPEELREPVAFDVVLPAIPTGLVRVRASDGPTLVHYWAPWEQDGRAQSHLLDSLAHTAEFESLRVVLVCFDPFPSVARYVGRTGLHLPVMLDGEHRLSHVLPCPSIPTTYVLDRDGRVIARQSGTVDWWAPGTLETLRRAMQTPAPVPDSARGAPRAPSPGLS
jgi:hypothetical protein